MSHIMVPFKAFADEVQTVVSEGTDGSGKKQYYVPYSALKKYWETDKISQVLHAFPGSSQNVVIDTFEMKYLRIFSILVYCTTQSAFRMNCIKYFIDNNCDDHNLPLDARNPAFWKIFPNSEEGREAWRAFNDHQFLFSPFPLGQEFPHDRTIAEGRLLPWKPGDILSEDSGKITFVQLYTINNDCELYKEAKRIAVKRTRLRHRDGRPNHDAEETFTNELNVYGALCNRPERAKFQDHFLKYYGSFRQGSWGYLLLEYADEGSLEQFYTKNNTPHDSSEMHDLWVAMFSLLDGLSILHYLDKNITNSHMRGTHQDLKPTNIFVFKVHTGELGYKYRFKIGDFGLSSIRLHNLAIHPDNKGGKMYGAPESIIPNPDHEDLDFGVTSKADIWSMGCIYFDMLVWVTCGQRGRDEFFAMREREGGSEAAFHSCTEGYRTGNLKALDDMLKLLLSRRRIFDNLTHSIAERIQHSMLCLVPDDRLDARYLVKEFVKVLEKAKSGTETTGSADTPVGHVQASPSCSRGTDENQSTARPHPNSRHTATPRIQSPSDALGIIETSDSSFQDTTRIRQSRTDGTRGQAPHLRFQTTRPGKERATIQTTLSTTQTDISHETDNAPSAHQPSPHNRARPSANTRRASAASAPGGTAAWSPRQSKQLEARPFSADPAGSASSTLNSLAPGPDQRHDPTSGESEFGTGLHVGLSDSLLSPTANKVAVSRANSARSTAGGYSTQSTAGGEFPNWTEPRVRDILEYKILKKRNKLPKGFVLQGLDDALRYQNGREQVFVLDDSATMYQYKPDVKTTVEALSYMVKGCDNNGVELFKISQPEAPIQDASNATTKIVTHLQDLGRPSSQNGHIERSFSLILDKVNLMRAGRWDNIRSRASRSQIDAKQPKVSLWVLTDGMWDDDDEYGCPAIANPIRNLMRKMKENHRDRTDIMIQFIQFGNDPEGTRRLRYLDNKLTKEPEMQAMKDYDIVDRKSWNSIIWDILIGSLNRKIDGGDSEEEEEGLHDGREARIASQLGGGSPFERMVQRNEDHMYIMMPSEQERSRPSRTPTDRTLTERTPTERTLRKRTPVERTYLGKAPEERQGGIFPHPRGPSGGTRGYH
ncbi:hypothetical protein QBC41DRAFT_311103 [Cercophora samala]|uniref:non-specific serine/threonine protein kinase n=1 Tax=Cercophora samala TaxID=330535 RepID=A0AA39ZLZ5_9PEZI|nr:hypothetical protein QBC41DRAFT_311103 [Cercophora samala]